MSLAPREIEQPRTDRQAETTAAIGTEAFGPLYREHFDGLYDFVVRIVRDSDLAGEIVQATFTNAWDALREGHELRYPKAWLYTVARNTALDEVRRRQRLADEPLAYAEADPSRLADPQAVAEDNEMVELVWSSAAALNPDEYSLLDLHVRHGFGAAELADALQLERGAVYTRLTRLRHSLEDSVTSTLLVRRAQDDCPELACIVAEHNTGGAIKITPELRQAVHEHVEHCDICTANRRRVVAPVALFGALVPIIPLAGMQEGILGVILPAGGHAAAGAAAAGGAGAATAARQGQKAKYLIGASAGVAATAAIVAVALSGGTSVSDPASASSPDHRIGVASSDPTVTMNWQPGKNARGYSVAFKQARLFEPPARENVTGTQYTSAPLAPGRWWFILRTHGKDGHWTHTLRVGPFVITAPVASKPHAKAKPATVKRARHASAKHAKSKHAAPVVAAVPITTGTQTPATAPRKKKPQPTPKAKPKTKTKPKTKGPPKSAPPALVPQPPPSTNPQQPAAGQPTTPTTPPVAQPPSPGTGGDDGDDDDGHDEGGGHGQGGGGHGDGQGQQGDGDHGGGGGN